MEMKNVVISVMVVGLLVVATMPKTTMAIRQWEGIVSTKRVDNGDTCADINEKCSPSVHCCAPYFCYFDAGASPTCV